MTRPFDAPEWRELKSWSEEELSSGGDARRFFEGALTSVPAQMVCARGYQEAAYEPGSRVRTILELGVYLRERDFFFFGIDRCSLPVAGDDDGPRWQVACRPFEGEIPCLYSVQRTDMVGQDQVYRVIPPQVLSLVDTVSFATGAGLGIRIRASSAGSGTFSSMRTDPRTGRRMRYSIRPYPQEPDGTQLCWIERSETGRGRGHAHGGSFPMF